MEKYRRYTTKSGLQQWKISMEFANELDVNDMGFCLNCKNVQPAEPDARKLICDACEMPKVYGASELVLMNLVF